MLIDIYYNFQINPLFNIINSFISSYSHYIYISFISPTPHSYRFGSFATRTTVAQHFINNAFTFHLNLFTLEVYNFWLYFQSCTLLQLYRWKIVSVVLSCFESWWEKWERKWLYSHRFIKNTINQLFLRMITVIRLDLKLLFICGIG